MVVTSTMSVSDVVMVDMPFVAAVQVRVPSVASMESSHSEPSVLTIIHPLAGFVPGKIVSLSPTSKVRPSKGCIFMVSLPAMVNVVPCTLSLLLELLFILMSYVAPLCMVQLPVIFSVPGNVSE